MTSIFPGTVPYALGKEPIPAGLTAEDLDNIRQQKHWEQQLSELTASCPAKAVMAGGAGLVFGGLFSLMTASMSYEDPMLRQNQATTQRARDILKETGRNMWSNGKSFGKIGAIYSSIECVIESYRAKNDIYNSASAGFCTGGVLARNAGPRAAFGGGLMFAAFSTAIDLFMRREPPDDD
ncbi:hypothetical protein MIND_00025200 [Mycena indigotica]|uniref:Mitochondrial import inner membrane translocase subunit TIM22 n=1 Tax=Mycena indigotica TaxID=2126181 RepID=A0A8H6TD47_9AGAR|nr:uncharacterized protein MIND_00025200 [Mycena indigotica]KAF7315109.1 hypothetical protein MIND_00025200 [Mycena indigotica]